MVAAALLVLDRPTRPGVVDDLALEIVEAHPVVVDDADLADAGRSEIENQGRAEAARADHKHARGFEALLAFAADLLKHQMAPVARDFVLGEHGLNLCLAGRGCQGD